MSPKRSNTPKRSRTSVRTTTKSSPRPSTRTTKHTSRSVARSSRSTPTSQRQSVSSRTTKTTRTVSRKARQKPIRRSQSTNKLKNLDVYKPKVPSLSNEDFKCIFCFKLPEFPKDKGRGIVLCPKCRYPAHADEFKDWLSSSGLCSRCNAPIPLSFRKNPKIISVKNYLIVYKDFLKKK